MTIECLFQVVFTYPVEGQIMFPFDSGYMPMVLYVKIQQFFVVIGCLWCYASVGWNVWMINYRKNPETSLTRMATRQENQIFIVVYW